MGVELLLLSKSDPDCQDCFQKTSLHWAAEKGFICIINALLNGNAAVNLPDKNCHTPLHSAAGAGHVEIIELLLANNASCEAKDMNDRTPLLFAAEKGQSGTFSKLLEVGMSRLEACEDIATPSEFIY